MIGQCVWKLAAAASSSQMFLQPEIAVLQRPVPRLAKHYPHPATLPAPVCCTDTQAEVLGAVGEPQR